MGLTKAYDELTSNPEFSDGLAVSNGQAIEDGGGTERLSFSSNNTNLKYNDGDKGILLNSGYGAEINTYSDEPFYVKDNVSGTIAVQYDTDPNIGTFILENAQLFHKSTSALFAGTGTYGGFSNTAIAFTGTSSTESQKFVMRNFNSNNVALYNQDGSMKLADSNLRLSTGQSIEDGSGNKRLELLSDRSSIYDELGDERIAASDSLKLSLNAKSNSPIQIQDKEGSFTAVQYTTDASTGTLELTNALLDTYVNNWFKRGGDTMISTRADSGSNRGHTFFAATKGNENTGDLTANGITWSLDETNDNLEFTVKYSDGTEKQGTVSVA